MNEFVNTKYFDFDEFANQRGSTGLNPLIRQLYFTIYEKACVKNSPIVLELGTNKGKSTLMFLQAVKERGGHVYSVDIDEQYSDLTNSPDWTFIHSDSTNIQEIIQKHPKLTNGIDILLIDSLHKREHVSKEFWGWEPYLNKDALIVFDDIDSNAYRPGARKDHVFFEFDWMEIREFVEQVFYANEDTLFLEMHFGSTGFAILTKRTDRSMRLKRDKPLKRRTNKFLWKLYVNTTNRIRSLIHN